jgi:3-oxoacyl-[acyl-carrier protein] reductase
MLGGGCALQLAEYGARLALIDIDAQKLETMVNKCQSAGLAANRIVSVVGDVTKVEDAQKIVQEAVRAFGKITNVVSSHI